MKLLTLSVLACLVLSACNNSISTQTNPLIGSWINNSSVYVPVLVFYDIGRVQLMGNTLHRNGVWEFINNDIVSIYYDGGTDTIYAKYDITDDILTINSEKFDRLVKPKF